MDPIWKQHCHHMAEATHAIADWCDDPEMLGAYLSLAAKWLEAADKPPAVRDQASIFDLAPASAPITSPHNRLVSMFGLYGNDGAAARSTIDTGATPIPPATPISLYRWSKAS